MHPSALSDPLPDHSPALAGTGSPTSSQAMYQPRPWSAPLSAVAFVVGPLAMLTFHALNEQFLPRDDARNYLAQVDSLGNRFIAITIAYMIAAALNVPIGLSIMRLLGRRWFGLIAGSFTIVAALGSFGLGAVNFALWGLIDDTGVSNELVQRYAAFQDSVAFPLVTGPIILGAIVGTVALLVGLVRTRVTPLWVPLVIAASFIAGSGEFGPSGNILGGILGVMSGVGLAMAILRSPR